MSGVSKRNIAEVNRKSRLTFEVRAEGESHRFETILGVLSSDGWSREGDRLLLTLPKNSLSEPQRIRAVRGALRRVQYLLKISNIDYEMKTLTEDVEDAQEEVLKAKIGLAGDPAVGKTSLVRRYVLDQFDDRYLSTIGAKVSKKEIHLQLDEGKSVRVDMSVWDVLGDRDLAESLMREYYRGIQGILLVVDITRRQTLQGAEEWVSTISKTAGEVPVHLLVNKVDLKGQFAMEQGDVASLSTRIRSPFFFTSAKTGKNVETAFTDLAMRILKRNGIKAHEEPVPRVK